MISTVFSTSGYLNTLQATGFQVSPKSCRKEKELPITRVTGGVAIEKILRKANEVSMTALKESVMIPALKAWRPSGFGVSFIGGDNLPNA